LAALTLLSAIPVINVIGWIQPSLQHARHLYWPSLWMTLLVALALERCQWRLALAISFLAVQSAGLSYNIRVYRDLFEKAGQIASQLQNEIASLPAVKEVRLMGVPENPNGVFYFRDELKERVGSALPGITVRFCESAIDCATRDEP